MKKCLSIFLLFFIAGVTQMHAANKPTRNLYTSLSGDTIEYKASAYVLQPNDKLGDLLIKMPGIVITKDNKIYAQGELVKMILLDGEEYFSDSPDVALHTIRADKVNKVQVYYKLSDQATFTGVEEKIKIRVLNIKLKKV